MKNEYDASTSTMEVESIISEKVKVPETATVKQLQEFSQRINDIYNNPMGLVATAFEDVFGEEFNDGTEEEQVKCQDVQLNEVG